MSGLGEKARSTDFSSGISDSKLTIQLSLFKFNSHYRKELKINVIRVRRSDQVIRLSQIISIFNENVIGREFVTMSFLSFELCLGKSYRHPTLLSLA